MNNTVNLCSYLGFCDNNMYTTGLNNYFWFTNATEMDANGYDMMNDDKFPLFRTIRGVVGPHWDNFKI